MKPKTIGIIGGAGPLAGAFLFERLIFLSGKIYGCHRDSDFPKIVLINFPFSEMLSPTTQPKKLRSELNECLEQLRKNGAAILAIACNTLHAFLDETDKLNDLINLPRTVTETNSLNCEPLVFCTSTSAKLGLHKQFFPCIYPDAVTQQKIDTIIDQILRGFDKNDILEKLDGLLREQSADSIVLGCTELSIFSAHLSVPNKQIIDPLEIMANKILEKSFLRRTS